MDYTEEELEKIQQVRLQIGDSPGSPFYPLFEDEEIARFLEMNKWNVRRATKQAAIAASLNFAQMVYRERTGDIEVWNNVSLQYTKALQDLIKDLDSVSAYGTLRPYFGGVSRCANAKNLTYDSVRSPLATVGINDCWPTFIQGYGIILYVDKEDNGYFYSKKGC